MDEKRHEWMSALPDHLKLNEITMPGTHNSCAFHCCVVAKCQKNSLAYQLNNGVRFIDVRCRHVNDSFRLHHGPFDLNFDFDTGCIDLCIQFLQANPSEVILILVSTEHKPESNQRQFDDVFLNYIEKNKDIWFLHEHCPSLAECRGKLVLLRRFSSKKKPLGIDMSGWRFNQTNEIKNHAEFGFRVQDVCNSTASKKWLQIKKLLDHANSGEKNIWYLNYCSAEKWPIQPPAFISWRVNKNLLAYLKNESQPANDDHMDNICQNTKSHGIIIIDFADKEIIQSIYKLNFN
ncbi:phosphatidylinositol diacylglycerol-lyase [Brachionus plicatilis]|uniref:Phosphatidylinositol diacylglycerol-lyase n=1 Tax=Brachionus plicatilis TaxID=10195 RepID=A0A3M7SSJ0_BRAPC|nr:phosphatidylinositol diacylglycerol-lyase [Brachionus plicatilis]